MSKLFGRTAPSTNFHKKHICGGTLLYVIREYTQITDEGKNRDRQIINQGSLFGNMIKKDSRKAFNIIKKLNLGNHVETCIKGLKCDSKEMKEIQDKYYGTLEAAQGKQVARDDLKKIFHNNGNNFTFEKYFRKLKGIYNVLDKYGFPLYED